jgi:hypothetical protein
MNKNDKSLGAVVGLLIIAVVGWSLYGDKISDRPSDPKCSNVACPCENCTCEDCKCGIEPEQEAGSPGKVPEKSFGNLPEKPLLRMHTMRGCKQCEIDKAQFGAWIDNGWRIEVFDDGNGEKGKIYPWYEVRELSGKTYSFVGPLSPDKVERERRNVTSSNR